MRTAALTPDLCVIGGGSAGLTLAREALRAGLSVVLVERNASGGRPRGAMSLGILRATAATAHAMRLAQGWGLRSAEAIVDWSAVRDHVRATLATLAPANHPARYRALGATVLTAAARFVGPKTLEAGDALVEPGHFAVATGSEPATPNIPGLESVRSLTTDTILDLETLPSHLLVLGGGTAGLELAQVFRRLGSLVTVIEADVPLRREDSEMTAAVLDRLDAEGVSVRSGCTVQAVEPGLHGNARVLARTVAGVEWFSGSHLLLAIGRAPRTAALGLERAGIVVDAGGIPVGADGRTVNRRVSAIGSVVAGNYPSGAGATQALLLLRTLRKQQPARIGPQDLPRVTFTMPELAAIGVTEAQARRMHGDIRVLRAPFSDTDRAWTDGIEGGHIKVIATPQGQVLGATIVAPGAADLLLPWILALRGRCTIRDLAEATVPSPTLSEATRQVARDFLADIADRPPARRLLRLRG